jgi:hypothetical protein
VGWFAIAFPALILNYLGQGALMFEHPPAHDGELFYSMAAPNSVPSPPMSSETHQAIENPTEPIEDGLCPRSGLRAVSRSCPHKPALRKYPLWRMTSPRSFCAPTSIASPVRKGPVTVARKTGPLIDRIMALLMPCPW